MEQFLADFELLENKIKSTTDANMKKLLENQLKAMSYENYVGAKSNGLGGAQSRKSCEASLDKKELRAKDYDEVSFFCAHVDKVRASFPEIAEDDFIKMVTLKFGQEAYARYKNSGKTFKEWKALRDWILLEFNSGLTTLQLIGRALDTPFEKSKGWKSFSIAMENRLLSAEAAILKCARDKKREETKMEEDELEKYQPSAREIIAFFGAAIVSDRIKSEDNDLFNRMASQWKDCTSPNEVGNAAQYYHAQNIAAENFHAKSKKMDSPAKTYDREEGQNLHAEQNNNRSRGNSGRGRFNNSRGRGRGEYGPRYGRREGNDSGHGQQRYEQYGWNNQQRGYQSNGWNQQGRSQNFNRQQGQGQNYGNSPKTIQSWATIIL